MKYKIAFSLLLIGMLGINFFAWANTLCGHTANTAWQLQYKTKTLKRVAFNKFVTQFCEPEAPANANTTVELLDKSGKLLYTKRTYLETSVFTDTEDPKTKGLTGGVKPNETPILAIKYPITDETKTARRIRVTVDEPNDFKAEGALE